MFYSSRYTSILTNVDSIFYSLEIFLIRDLVSIIQFLILDFILNSPLNPNICYPQCAIGACMREGSPNGRGRRSGYAIVATGLAPVATIAYERITPREAFADSGIGVRCNRGHTPNFIYFYSNTDYEIKPCNLKKKE